VIYLRGPIASGDETYFFKLVSQLEGHLSTINVISQGGVTDAASEIGKFLFKNDVRVEVAGPCFSSCANYLFGFSRKRLILPSGLVGFHGNHTALVEEMGGIEVLKKQWALEGKMTEEKIEMSIRRFHDVVSRESEIYAYFNVPQSFFDLTQTHLKGFAELSDNVDYSFLYPDRRQLDKLGFKIESGENQFCYAYEIFSRAHKKSIQILIAR
jgi:hypothetical protein